MASESWQINSLVYRLLFFLNFSPIIRITVDDNFGTIPWDIDQLDHRHRQQFRFSLISFNLGMIILHFCSFGFFLPLKNHDELKSPKKDTPKGFRLFYCLKLKDLQVNTEESQLRYERYAAEHEIDLLSVEEASSYQVFANMLTYNIDAVRDTRSRSLNKFLGYLTVFALITPFIVPLTYKLPSILEKPLWQQSFLWIFSYYIIINLVNLILFFYRFIKVRTYYQFKYSKVRNSEEPDFELLRALFYDKYQLQEESINEVTNIKNIEKYIFGIALVCILTLVSTGISQFVPETKYANAQTSSSSVFEVNISTTPQNMFKENNKLIEVVKVALLQNELRELILVTSQKSSVENYRRIVQLIEAYNTHHTNIIKLTTEAAEQEGRLQIILIRR